MPCLLGPRQLAPRQHFLARGGLVHQGRDHGGCLHQIIGDRVIPGVHVGVVGDGAVVQRVLDELEARQANRCEAQVIRAACQSGAMLVSAHATNAAAMANPITGQSIATSSTRVVTALPKPTSTRTSAKPNNRPPAAPGRDTSNPSRKYCCASWRNPAPSATRTAVSRARATERASNSPPTFAQVMSSRRRAAPNSSHRTGLMSLVVRSRMPSTWAV